MQRDEAHLLDIIIAAKRAVKYIGNVSRSDFEKTEMIQHAVALPPEEKI